jgi:acyl-CoA thioesterase-1
MSRLLVLIALAGFPLLASAAGTLLVFGDSLSAGYGLARDDGWVGLLAQRIGRVAPDYKVVNASISGETAAGGRRRIEAALTQHKPAIVILELGANDGLRGQRTDTLRTDLAAIVSATRRHGAQVVLVAKQFRIPLVPFLFEGFGERQELFQADGIHPTREAQPLMLETVWRVLGPMLSARRSAASPR